jgi:branched-chain amino acid transport system ATP-binding protein
MVLRDGTRALLGRTRSKTAQVAGGGSGGSAPSSPPTSSAPVAPGAAPAAAAAAPASPLAAVTTAIAGPPAATTQPGRANGDDSAAATAVATVEHVAAVSVPAVTDQAGDDLQLINGIGPAIERQLRAHGVTRFEQIANWSGADVERIDELLSFRGRVVRENWVGQAKKLAKAATTGAGTHSARARKPIARHPAGRKPGE